MWVIYVIGFGHIMEVRRCSLVCKIVFNSRKCMRECLSFLSVFIMISTFLRIGSDIITWCIEIVPSLPCFGIYGRLSCSGLMWERNHRKIVFSLFMMGRIFWNHPFNLIILSSNMHQVHLEHIIIHLCWKFDKFYQV